MFSRAPLATSMSISGLKFLVMNGCFNAYSVVILVSGFLSNSLSIKSLASLLIGYQTFSGSNLCLVVFFLMQLRVSISEPLWNGGSPESKMQRITPHDHRSHCLLYFLCNTSGAIQKGVPIFSDKKSLESFGVHSIAVPKSIIFNWSKSLFYSRRIFSGLRSLNVNFKINSIILPMNDIVLVQVIHTSKYISHYLSSFLLFELASSNQLIIQLTTFTEPILLILRYLTQ